MFGRPKVRSLQAISSRFGLWFTVAAIVLAVLGAVLWWPDVRMSAEVATAVLIIACPCALTLAAPITVGTAMTVLGRAGLYLKHAAVAMDEQCEAICSYDRDFDRIAGIKRMEPKS